MTEENQTHPADRPATGDEAPGPGRYVFSESLRRVRRYIDVKLYARRYKNFRPTPTGDAVVSGIDDQVASIAGILRRGDLELFLRRLSELTGLLFGSLFGEALFIPELDELARKASLQIATAHNATVDSELVVHVASVVSPTGGHTRVIEDVVSALPGYRHVLILTGMAHLAPMDLRPLMPRFEKLGLEIVELKSARCAEKARELSSITADLSPRAVMLFAHHADSVAFAGVAGHAAPRVLFMHQCDHFPALGATRSDYAHVDLTPTCHGFCKSHPSLRPSLLNLTVQDAGTIQSPSRTSLIGVTCGSSHKYEGKAEFSYADLVAELLSGGVSQLLHIGDMPQRQMNQIRAEIRAANQDPGRVSFLPSVPSLAEKLKEIAPDFYLTSHPLGSGKATLEAMSVGLPILFVCAESTPPLLNADMNLGNSVPIRALRDVPAALKRLQTEKAILARASRDTYETSYSVRAFREKLISILSGG